MIFYHRVAETAQREERNLFSLTWAGIDFGKNCSWAYPWSTLVILVWLENEPTDLRMEVQYLPCVCFS